MEIFHNMSFFEVSGFLGLVFLCFVVLLDCRLLEFQKFNDRPVA